MTQKVYLFPLTANTLKICPKMHGRGFSTVPQKGIFKNTLLGLTLQLLLRKFRRPQNLPKTFKEKLYHVLPDRALEPD